MASSVFFHTLLEHADPDYGVEDMWNELPYAVRTNLREKGHITNEEYLALLQVRPITQDPFVNKQIIKRLDRELTEVLGV